MSHRIDIDLGKCPAPLGRGLLLEFAHEHMRCVGERRGIRKRNSIGDIYDVFHDFTDTRAYPRGNLSRRYRNASL
jgi:hypothetical protein